jgi:eukaryotic-like serine/threonine-protein kinase
MSGQHFQVVGRYLLGSPLASGGMATVYLGRPLSLPRVVAIKRLSPELAGDMAFVRMFLDEVQLLCRIRHRNVVAPIEHFQHEGEFFIVMEYVEGLSLAHLSAAGEGPLDAHLASKIMDGVLTGLHAAHEAVDSSGQPLNMVHRDVSPHNILVATDGESRIADFGIAKAAWRAQVTQHGERKGKPGYMAPEQWSLAEVDRRTDVYAAGVVLWELLTGTRLFPLERPSAAMPPFADLSSPSARNSRCRALDEVTMRALSVDPGDRFRDAAEMADALRAAATPARDLELGAWVSARGKRELARRAALITELESVRPGDITPVNRGYSVPDVLPATFAIAAPRVLESAPPAEARARGRAPAGFRQGVAVALTIVGALVVASYIAQTRNRHGVSDQVHQAPKSAPPAKPMGVERERGTADRDRGATAARGAPGEDTVVTDRGPASPASEGIPTAASAAATAPTAKGRSSGVASAVVPAASVAPGVRRTPLASETAGTSATPAYDPLRDARRH